MDPKTVLLAFVGWLFTVPLGYAAIFGTVTGIVLDPQERPIARAVVTVRARSSDWQAQGPSDMDGKFSFTTVPAGEYTVSVRKDGFQGIDRVIVVRSGTVTNLLFSAKVGEVTETVDVSAASGVVNTKTVTTESLVTRDDIDRTPGAIRTNSLDMVTQFTPGAYMVHDQLHVRGGHQVSWLVDGVPVPNTNIASNVGPQFDPKDVDTIEVQRGGYSADFGDRTFGVFNVITRSGFEYTRQGEVVANYGNYHETNDQISLGNHTDRTAYFVSLNANHTELGLETPVEENLHNTGSGVGGFGSLVTKWPGDDQLRIVASVRGDRYQIPNGPDDQAAGIDDLQHERDAFVNASWIHTLGSAAFLTVSPFYHYNRSAFDGGTNDPVVTTDHRTSQYLGAQAVVAVSKGRHNARFGAYSFYQKDDVLFGLRSNGSDGGDGAPSAPLSQSQSPSGNLEVVFAEDEFTATDWLTLNGGVRVTRFAGALVENAVSPRVGAAVRVPQLNWAVRAFYGRYYQAPPLTTVAGPLLDVAVQQGFGFLPLAGERDEQYEVGVAIPARGWSIDLDHFQTNARNFFDHDVIGNSNIFIPLTIDAARIRGWEATVRSPRRQRVQAHLAYSHQFAEGRGGVNGGLTSFAPPSDDYFFLDHDQRDTLTARANIDLPAATWVSGSIGYGSGFLEGNGPDHKPAHVIFSLEGSKSLGKQWTVVVTALNVANTHFLLDESNTFGGTHFNMPRQVSAGIRYRFHY